MNYWLSDAKTPDGATRVAAFNIQERDDGMWIGAVVINEHTQAGSYRLFNGRDIITLELPAERATQDGFRCVVDEVWETT